MATDKPIDESMEYQETYNALDALLNGPEPDQEDLETVYENTGLDLVSNLYGLARREEEFQDLYRSFQRYSRLQNFRETHPRKKKAYNDFIDSFENYMGELSAEEEAKAHHDAAQIVANEEVFNGLSNMIGEVTEADMRQLLTDVRETTR